MDMHLVIAIQWKYKGSIGGMSQRFVPVALNLFEKGLSVQCLTTYSLLEHLNISPDHPALLVIDDRKNREVEILKQYVLILKMLARKELKSIHLAGGNKFFTPLIYLAKLKQIKLSCTFASRTLDMASYNNIRTKKTWIRTLELVDKIDVLNPSHNLHKWSDKISVSPCSFPSRLLNHNYNSLLNIEKENIAVFSGALVPTKNPILACEIIRLAIESKAIPKDFKLYIFGSGALKSQIQLLKTNHSYSFIKFGEQTEYFKTLKKAKLFFSLQEYDNYPSQSLMEAMFYGANCICTADGDTHLLFENTDNNIILDSRDAYKFCEQLAYLDINIFNNSNKYNIEHNFTLDRFSNYFANFISAEVEV